MGRRGAVMADTLQSSPQGWRGRAASVRPADSGRPLKTVQATGKEWLPALDTPDTPPLYPPVLATARRASTGRWSKGAE